MPILNYVEFSVPGVPDVRAFYEGAFGWTFTEYGSEYAAVEGGPVTAGFNATAQGSSPAILPLIEVEDLEAALKAAMQAGGVVRVPIFAYPGGRRFQVVDPAGNEIGIYQSD